MLTGVHAIPSADRRLVPPSPTAKKAEPVWRTLRSTALVPLVRAVHVPPSEEERITPPAPTVTKAPPPKATRSRFWPVPEVTEFHEMPLSVERRIVPALPTAMTVPVPLLATPDRLVPCTGPATWAVQATPSGEVRI